MRPSIDVSPALRALCFGAVAAVAFQLIVLDEPEFAQRLVAATWDKAVHFTVFGGIAFLLWVGFAGRYAALVWTLVVLVGALDETHQMFVPGRDPDLHDLYADGMGAAASLVFFQALATVRPAPRPSRLFCGD